MEGGRDFYWEWSYENLGFWNREIHGVSIQSLNCPFVLYPRGIMGDEDGLVVDFCDRNDPSIVELSFIDFDGTVVLKQEMKDPKWRDHRVSFRGPNFQQIVRERERGSLHKDIFTLRCYGSNLNCPPMCHGKTRIDVNDVQLQILTLRDIRFDTNSKWTSIFYRNIGNEKYKLDLRASSSIIEGYIVFAFYSHFPNKIFISTHTCVLNGETVVEKREDDGIVDEETHCVFNTIQRKDEFCLFFDIKVVSGDLHNTRYFPPVQNVISTTDESVISSKSVGNSTKDVNIVSSNQPLTVLSNDLMCLYQDQSFSDFELRCGSVSFPTHKAILSARSPILKTMLSTDMKEAASGFMEIVDMDVPTLASFLTFLYSGTANDLEWEKALKLYYAAEKYQIHVLKSECSAILSANLSVSNVCDVLSLADKLKDDHLTSVSRNFVLRNYNEVLSSEEWAAFMKSDSLLALEIVTYFAKGNFVGEINRS